MRCLKRNEYQTHWKLAPGVLVCLTNIQPRDNIRTSVSPSTPLVEHRVCAEAVAMQQSAVILLCTLGIAFADVKSDFEAAKIVPDIIDSAPLKKIEIKYGDKEVNLGNEFAPTETKNIPEVHYEHEGGVLYTLVMTDPDIPVRGYNREWQHWVVGNIPEDKVAKGEVLTEYVGPAPPKGSGKHRYVFLLYKQNQGSITFDERRIGNRDNRRNRFSVKKLAEKYNLEGPLAGNYLKAEYDDYVPVIHKQIGN